MAVKTPVQGAYNAARDLLERNLTARPAKTAFIDADGEYSYFDVAVRVEQCAFGLGSLGLAPSDRIVLCLFDGIDFVAAFLGAIKAGLVPIPLNTLFKPHDYAYVLTDSGAKAAVVSADLAPVFREAIRLSGWQGRLVVAGAPEKAEASLARLMTLGRMQTFHDTRADDIAFWLYSSGSTGRPKGAPHRHSSLMLTAELFAQQTLGIRETDVVYSAAKLFFAYGLGNSLTFPMSVGATTVLFPRRVLPDIAASLIKSANITMFCGAPTLYAGILSAGCAPQKSNSSLRLCLSAGEGLPSNIAEAWVARTGIDIIDGIGSTEMLHIYVSNRPGDIRYGSTGRPVPGYDVRLVADNGEPTSPGEIGELLVRGPTMTPFYWNQPEKTKSTFVDGWMRTGDKFIQDRDGRYAHCGRADDMLKVSGNWVSPTEVENALLAHEDVLEAAVIGVPDEDGLIKSKAFVILKPGVVASELLASRLQDFTKLTLPPYKYPRLVEFVAELPKTATGKIQRHVLRERSSSRTRS